MFRLSFDILLKQSKQLSLQDEVNPKCEASKYSTLSKFFTGFYYVERCFIASPFNVSKICHLNVRELLLDDNCMAFVLKFVFVVIDLK